MISPAGSEGINLKNTRYVHIVDPYFTEQLSLSLSLLHVTYTVCAYFFDKR